MANDDITLTQKNPGKIYVGVAVPSAGAEITIGSDGVPDATENPLAKCLGLTEKGSIVTIGKTVTEEFFDEYKDALERNIDQVMMSIKADVSQVLDWDVVEAALSGVGTAQTVTGKKKVKIGEGTFSYTGVCVIAPTKANSAKFLVAHIYRGYQTNNVDIEVSRQTRAKMSLEFKAVVITSRAKDDSLGAYWKTT